MSCLKLQGSYKRLFFYRFPGSLKNPLVAPVQFFWIHLKLHEEGSRISEQIPNQFSRLTTTTLKLSVPMKNTDGVQNKSNIFINLMRNNQLFTLSLWPPLLVSTSHRGPLASMVPVPAASCPISLFTWIQRWHQGIIKFDIQRLLLT